MDDDELIHLTLARDDLDAFGELVRRHQARVRALLRRLCRGDEHRADDLAQETFIRAHRRLATFDRARRFDAWLGGIALNEFRNDRRRHREELRESCDDHLASRVSPTHASDARLDLEAAMQLLSADEVAALTLCYQHGQSHEEAADTLGVPLGTVKSWIHRGRQRLRSLLEEKLTTR